MCIRDRHHADDHGAEGLHHRKDSYYLKQAASLLLSFLQNSIQRHQGNELGLHRRKGSWLRDTAASLQLRDANKALVQALRRKHVEL